MKSRTHFTDGRSAIDYDAMYEQDFNARRMVQKNLSRQEFGKRLFNLMVNKGWNQAELAREADVLRDSISNYIRGNHLPEPANLKKLAVALDVKPEDLLPNVAANEIKLHSAPPLEIKSGADPTTSWIKINRLVRTSELGKILDAVNAASIDSGD